MDNYPKSYGDKLAHHFSLWIVIITGLMIGGYMIYGGQPSHLVWWFSAILFLAIDLVPFIIALALMRYICRSVWQTCIMLAGFVVCLIEVYYLLRDTFATAHPYALAKLSFFQIPILVSIIMTCAIILVFMWRWFVYNLQKK